MSYQPVDALLGNQSFDLDDLRRQSNDSSFIVLDADPGEETETAGTLLLRMSFMNMANSILGAGVIGQPYAFRQCGVLGGVVALALLTFLVDWTLQLVVVNGKLLGQKLYTATVTHCFGTPGRWTILVVQGLFAYGGTMAFCVIIGDTVPHVLQSFLGTSGVMKWLTARNTVLVVTTTCVLFPLSLSRDISHLSKALMMALLGMVAIVGIVLVHGPHTASELRGTIPTAQWFVNPHLFQGVLVILFALVCHHNTMFIFNSLRMPTLDRFVKLTHISCLVAMAACGGMGLGGFAIFGNLTKGNVLNNFSPSDTAANVARLLFGLNMLTTIPLEVFVVRDVVRDLVDPHWELPTRHHVAITAFLVFTPMFVALFTCNLGAILELAGSTTASVMAYILPPLCYLKMSPGLDLKQRVGVYGCVAFGFAILIISSAQTIYGALKGNEVHCVI